MNRIAVILLAALIFAAPAAAEIKSGKAKGTIDVSGRKTPLKHAYLVEKASLLKLVLSDQPIPEEAFASSRAFQEAADANGFSAIVLQLDEGRGVDEAFYYHSDLPSGLSERLSARISVKVSNDERMAGKVASEDIGNSFGYEATFDAPIVHLAESVEPLPADASPADHAIWRLKQLEIEYDEDSFRNAVMNGQADVVELFLIAGMPVETAGALTEAVERGHTETAKLLISKGADFNARDSYGQSLVMRAASLGKPEILEALIKAGADVNVMNEYRIAPLSVAAERGDLEAVKMLLAAKAKVDARDTSGGTALTVAVLRGYAEIVRTLLDAGADVKRQKDMLLELSKDNAEVRAMIEKALKKK